MGGREGILDNPEGLGAKRVPTRPGPRKSIPLTVALGTVLSDEIHDNALRCLRRRPRS